jgi:hypothetical protein
MQGNLIDTDAQGTSITGTDGRPLGNGGDSIFVYYLLHNDNVTGDDEGSILSVARLSWHIHAPTSPANMVGCFGLGRGRRDIGGTRP